MRRAVLIVALVVLVLVDMSLIPMALFLIVLGGSFGAGGHVGRWLPIMLYSLFVAAVPAFLTIVVAKALRRTAR
jgi:hypothetical protein